jgi:hypothetical protein
MARIYLLVFIGNNDGCVCIGCCRFSGNFSLGATVGDSSFRFGVIRSVGHTGVNELLLLLATRLSSGT